MTDPSLPSLTVRAAEPRDLTQLVALIGALAEYEHLTSLLEVTPEKLQPHLFGERPVAEALVVERAPSELVGFALFFTSFSTFLGKPGLYLEDLFVLPAYRRQGIGRSLLRALAARVIERGYGRLEWSVLDWNTPAISFYQELGASVMREWLICRMTGAALEELARPRGA